VGRGGSVYFIDNGDDQTFWLKDFKPFDLSFGTPGHGVGDKGVGRWIKPWFQTADDSLSWLIMAVRRGFSFSSDITDDDVDSLTEDDMYSL
jgi:hypothetical protein